MAEITCPLCHGNGCIPGPKKKPLSEIQKKQKAVLALFSAGYSYREIQKMLGYKSHSSVQKIIDQHG